MKRTNKSSFMSIDFFRWVLWGDWDYRDWIQQGIDWRKSEVDVLMSKSYNLKKSDCG